MVIVYAIAILLQALEETIKSQGPVLPKCTELCPSLPLVLSCLTLELAQEMCGSFASEDKCLCDKIQQILSCR